MMDEHLRDNVERLLRGKPDEPAPEFVARIGDLFKESDARPVRTRPPRPRFAAVLVASAALVLFAGTIWQVFRARPVGRGTPAGAGAKGQETREPLLVSKPGAFRTLVNPNCSHCIDEARRRKGDVRDDDRVLGWIRGSYDGGAIPYRFFLNPYRVISDTYGVFVHDPDAGYARGVAPSLDFTFHGWRNGVMVLKHKDGTLYSGLTGIAFEGPKKGSRLEPVPTLVSDWGFWVQRYPRAVAYHLYEKYQPVELPAEIHEDSNRSRGPADGRLPSTTPVLGVVEGAHARAYPLETLAQAGLIRDTVEGQDRVVLWFESTRTAAAYRPLASPPKADLSPPRTVTLEIDSKTSGSPFCDRETGSRWDVTGRAVEGDLKGWTLTWLDGTQVKWFAWAAEYPQTSIYGK